MAGLGYLGLGLDEGVNTTAQADAELSSPGAAVRSFVVAAREDLEIARGVRAVLGEAGPGGARPA